MPSTPQLPFKISQLSFHRDHKALNRGPLGVHLLKGLCLDSPSLPGRPSSELPSWGTLEFPFLQSALGGLLGIVELGDLL